MNECCICLESIKKGSFKTECCGQELHQKCIEKWTGKCPLCKGDYIKDMIVVDEQVPLESTFGVPITSLETVQNRVGNFVQPYYYTVPQVSIVMTQDQLNYYTGNMLLSTTYTIQYEFVNRY